MSKTLSREQVLALAEHVENAELQAQDITKVTNDYPDMTFEDAYDVQWEIRRRKEERGNKIVGMKMCWACFSSSLPHEKIDRCFVHALCSCLSVIY